MTAPRCTTGCHRAWPRPGLLRQGLLAACVLFAGGCLGSVGELCTADDDCRAGLRCTAQGGSRGVCVYPEALHDGAPPADASPPDRSRDVPAADLRAPDLASDLLPDRTSAENRAEVALPDANTPDANTPDANTPDANTPDATRPPDGAADGP